MTLFTDAGVMHASAVAREVYDVSGAGDTVIATLAVPCWARACRSSMLCALANRAAGIVVGKLGTATVDYDELFLNAARRLARACGAGGGVSNPISDRTP